MRRYPSHQNKPDVGFFDNAHLCRHPLRMVGSLLPAAIRRRSGLLLPAPRSQYSERFKVWEMLGETRRPKLPQSLLGQEIDVAFRDYIPHLTSDPTFVLEVPHGSYHGHDHTLFDQEFNLIDWRPPYWATECGLPGTMFRGRLGNPRYLPGRALVLSAPGATGNLWHVLFDSLAKLKVLEMAGMDVGSYDHILVNSLQMPAEAEACAHLGLPAAKLTETDSVPFITADSLTVVSIGCLNSPDPWVLNWLREKFCSTHTHDQTAERLFLSRGDAQRRRFRSEEDFFALLKPHGFRKAAFAKMTLAEQVNAVQRAKVIVAPHGAGLTNIVWAAPGTRVFELFSAEYVTGCYWLIAAALNLDYWFALGDPTMEKRYSGKAIMDMERLGADIYYADLGLVARKLIEQLD